MLYNAFVHVCFYCFNCNSNHIILWNYHSYNQPSINLKWHGIKVWEWMGAFHFFLGRSRFLIFGFMMTHLHNSICQWIWLWLLVTIQEILHKSTKCFVINFITLKICCCQFRIMLLKNYWVKAIHKLFDQTLPQRCLSCVYYINNHLTI